MGLFERKKKEGIEKSPKLEFEQIESDPFYIRIFRTKVIGGWLVASSGTHERSICFIPDPEHQWKIGEPS